MGSPKCSICHLPEDIARNADAYQCNHAEIIFLWNFFKDATTIVKMAPIRGQLSAFSLTHKLRDLNRRWISIVTLNHVFSLVAYIYYEIEFAVQTVNTDNEVSHRPNRCREKGKTHTNFNSIRALLNHWKSAVRIGPHIITIIRPTEHVSLFSINKNIGPNKHNRLTVVDEISIVTNLTRYYQ